MLSKSVQIKNIYVLPNLTEPEVFYTNDVSKYRQDDITIGYCGTPTRKDGVLDLLESFAMLCQKTKKVHLLIIGDVVSGISVIPSLEERAKILGISDKVSFTGLVPHSKIPHLLNSCQILALTRPNGVSAEAGFPSKLGEYFACRKPVLVTKVGDIPKYFVSGEHAIIVEPGDIFGIAKGFQEIIENNELASKIAANGYLWMSNNIDFKKASHMLNQFIA